MHTENDSEQWLPVAGWEGYYEVSDQGRVRSVTRVHWNGRSESLLQGRIKKLTAGTHGYLVCSFWRNGKGRTVLVHDLVAGAFIRLKLPADTVNHISGNKRDNRPANLEYLSLADNSRHAASIGLCARGETNGRAKLTEDAVREIRALRTAGVPLKVVAARFGISEPAASEVANRRKWRHVA